MPLLVVPCRSSRPLHHPHISSTRPSIPSCTTAARHLAIAAATFLSDGTASPQSCSQHEPSTHGPCLTGWPVAWSALAPTLRALEGLTPTRYGSSTVHVN
ncbi:hypothetical protein IQ07DRAFT_273252 [Pyrenochaeta sp. DS3sAY3a]|nr:hypothetical protein IQ07DRAFT_273252 [Pyrenochaeta sp. DS3sAY3a]